MNDSVRLKKVSAIRAQSTTGALKDQKIHKPLRSELLRSDYSRHGHPELVASPRLA